MCISNDGCFLLGSRKMKQVSLASLLCALAGFGEGNADMLLNIRRTQNNVLHCCNS